MQITAAERPARTPSAIPLDQISISNDFRFRPFDRTHKADLAGVIKATGKPLDPILLWQQPGGREGDKLTVLDGVHRLAAYRGAGWPHPVPAWVITCDRREALGEALRANSKLVLAMTLADRLDAAWRLVREHVEPRFKVREIAELANVSGRTVDAMRARLKVMAAQGVQITGEWWRDKREWKMPDDDDAAGDFLTDDQRAAEIDRLADDFRDLIDRRKHPQRAILRESEAVEQALIQAIGERRAKAIIAWHFDLEPDDWLRMAAHSPDDEPGDDHPGF